MPPRKKPISTSTPSAPLPPPNESHPSFSQLSSTLSNLPSRPHSISYHQFFTSSTSAPPKKKQKLANGTDSEEKWEVQMIQEKLLDWFEGKREERNMPWRKDVRVEEMNKKEKSQRGYEVWVSEIMLQQTQVATVIAYYNRWITAFPTVKHLSEATLDEVNSIWTGLGYYSRAKRLFEGSKTVMRDFKGMVPDNVEDLLKIEGIGPYSAGAISSIAFGNSSSLVDGNVTRVLSRLTAFHSPSTAKATTNYIWALADQLVPEEGDGEGKIKNRPGSWNQGLMELGATVCTPKNPKCGECPISEECLGYQEVRYLAQERRKKSSLDKTKSKNDAMADIEDLSSSSSCTLCTPPPETSTSSYEHSVEIYPMAKERKKQREEDTLVCLVEWQPAGDESGEEGKKVLVMKRPEKGLLAGLFEFPSIDLPPTSTSTSTGLSKSDRTLLLSFLRTLIKLPKNVTFTPSTTTLNDSISVITSKEFEPVIHVYSHIIRTYKTIRIVLSSNQLPTLLPSSSTSTKKPVKKSKKKQDESESEEEEEMIKSLPGSGKWINLEKVESESLGGAFKKIWEVRQGRGGEKKLSKASGKGGKKEVKEEKGQKSLMGFFGGSSQGSTKKSKKEESGDDEVVIIERKVLSGKKGRKEEEEVDEVDEGEKKVYKKRRIAPASDEEDE
ncbi:hypothetical protein JCM5353_003452 [Sporobolomyces roseus]